MTAVNSSQQPPDCPRWLVSATCFAVQAFVRAGLWVAAVEIRCASSSRRGGVKWTLAPTGLSGVNLGACAVGTALGYLARAVFLVQLCARWRGKRWKRGLPGEAMAAGPCFATHLRD